MLLKLGTGCDACIHIITHFSLFWFNFYSGSEWMAEWMDAFSVLNN
jgi:hypothetical protein